MSDRYHFISSQRIRLTVLLLVAFGLLAAGCAPHHRRSSRWEPERPKAIEQTFERKKPEEKPPEKVDPPETARILVNIKDWEIYNHRLLNWSQEYGSMTFSGRFVMNKELVFKFVSDKFYEYYWLAKVPTVKSGQYTINGRRYTDTYMADKLPDPPRSLELFLKVQDKRIKHHFIVDLNPSWGNFVFDRIGDGYLYLRNDWYPGNQWAAQLPKSDGDWTLHVQLLSTKR